MTDIDMPIHITSADRAQTPSTYTKVAPGWNLRMIFTTEPALAMIAIEAASAKWLSYPNRLIAFATAMQKADKLVGEDASDPRLRYRDAWDLYNDYVFDLLRL